MWLCEGKLKVKIAHFRLPSASQKRACSSSLLSLIHTRPTNLGGLNRIRTQDLCEAGGMFYRLSYEATECRSFRLQVVSPTSRFAYTEVDLPEVGESTLSV